MACILVSDGKISELIVDRLSLMAVCLVRGSYNSLGFRKIEIFDTFNRLTVRWITEKWSKCDSRGSQHLWKSVRLAFQLWCDSITKFESWGWSGEPALLLILWNSNIPSNHLLWHPKANLLSRSPLTFSRKTATQKNFSPRQYRWLKSKLGTRIKNKKFGIFPAWMYDDVSERTFSTRPFSGKSWWTYKLQHRLWMSQSKFCLNSEKFRLAQLNPAKFEINLLKEWPQ